MAQSFARCSLCQNPFFDSKNEFVGGTPIKSSNCHTLASTAIYIFTPAIAPIITLLIASGSANSSLVKYLNYDLQRIVKTIIKARPLLSSAPAPVPALVVTTAPHYKSSCELFLKAQFPDIYRGKPHMECYNFFQQYKDYFATANAMEPNQFLFAAIFPKDTALFRSQ